MNEEINTVKIGLFLVMMSLLFGIALGIIFGVAEDSVKSYISENVASHAEIHDDKSKAKIWRYAQRTHFHATGISAFSLGLIFLIMFSTLTKQWKMISSFLVGLGGLYPLSWFTMFLIAPFIGREAAHDHLITEIFAYSGTAGLLLGILLLSANLFLGKFKEIS